MGWITRRKGGIIVVAIILIVLAVVAVGLARMIMGFCGFMNRYIDRADDQEKADDAGGAADDKIETRQERDTGGASRL